MFGLGGYSVAAVDGLQVLIGLQEIFFLRLFVAGLQAVCEMKCLLTYSSAAIAFRLNPRIRVRLYANEQ